MCETLCLTALREGESGYVLQIHAQPAMKRRLADLGLIRGTRVTCVARSPAGAPVAYLIRGALIALRRMDAEGILLERQAVAP